MNSVLLNQIGLGSLDIAYFFIGLILTGAFISYNGFIYD